MMPIYIRFPLKILDGLLDRIIAVFGVMTMAQFPQFVAQYLQRLGGHLEEARNTVFHFEKAAEALNMTLEEYIKIHLFSGNEVFLSSGEVIEELIFRLQELEQSFTALKEATPLNRWLVFLKVYDPEIAVQTWHNFTPGIPTTLEGAVYGLIGLLVAWGLYRGVKKLLVLLYNKFRDVKPLERTSGVPLNFR